MNVKLPLFPKYCLSIYLCYNTLPVIEPNLTGKEGEKRRRNGTEIQPTATPAETKEKAIHGLRLDVGNPGGEPPRAPESR